MLPHHSAPEHVLCLDDKESLPGEESQPSLQVDGVHAPEELITVEEHLRGGKRRAGRGAGS